MARLTTKARGALSSSNFAGPGRSFPVEDKKHARAALMDVGKAKGLTSSQKATVRARAERKLGK
jgi:hypothetical protein